MPGQRGDRAGLIRGATLYTTADILAIDLERDIVDFA
jgi:hypothetical protein